MPLAWLKAGEQPVCERFPEMLKWKLTLSGDFFSFTK